MKNVMFLLYTKFHTIHRHTQKTHWFSFLWWFLVIVWQVSLQQYLNSCTVWSFFLAAAEMTSFGSIWPVSLDYLFFGVVSSGKAGPVWPFPWMWRISSCSLIVRWMMGGRQGRKTVMEVQRCSPAQLAPSC